MHPVQEPLDADTRFISMLQRARDEPGLEALDRRFERFGRFGNPVDQASFRQLTLTQIG
jgi:hypothetical protein